MRTLAVVVTAWLAQSPTTTINDPTVQSKKVTTTTLGSKQALDVASIDGGVRIIGSLAITGGPISVNILDAGPPINVQGPLTDTQLRATPVPVSGTVSVAAPVTVDGTVTANQGGAPWSVSQSGTWTVQPGNTANTTPWLTTDTPRTVASANNTGTCTNITVSATVLASNASRRAYGFKASEANTANVHCKLGATATTSNTIFGPGASWSQDTGAVYTGVIDCIAASGTQAVCVYEMN